MSPTRIRDLTPSGNVGVPGVVTMSVALWDGAAGLSVCQGMPCPLQALTVGGGLTTHFLR